MFCLGKGLGDFGRVAKVIVERDVVRHGIEHQRRAGLHRVRRLEHNGQRLDIERHRFGCVFRLCDRFRNDAGDGISDETDFVCR